MTSAVAPTRPFPAGCRHSPRRSPAVLSLGAAARRAPTATKCSALASPEKQSTAKPPPPPPPPATRRAPDAEATDYNEVAAALESIYKLSPALVEEEEEDKKKKKKKGKAVIVRSRRRRRGRRMDLGKRVEMRRRKAEEEDTEEALIREHAAAAETGGFEWRRMSIPPVLSSAQSARLFKLMQPMKAIFEVQENLQKDVEREPTEGELAEAMNMTVPQLRRHLNVGIAARNKLIKHNLRLVLYAINKYYPDLASNDRFDDLCQAGANGLITAIDRFELKRGFRISTYALFWIRHSIVRAITLSSFTRFPFAMESERKEIHKAREELSFELGRPPTEQEIIQRVGISPARYRDILRMTKPIYSLNSRHRVTQEELINEVTDADALGVDHQKHNTLLRLALDDLLDSLKPKESLVIRQRFGLDGKGKRTLGEIAGNLSISREMVRKYELKALIKLKHPTRVDYLRRYM